MTRVKLVTLQCGGKSQLQPLRDGATQSVVTTRGWVGREIGKKQIPVSQQFDDKWRRSVFGFANRERNMLEGCGGRNTGFELVQPLKRIGLEGIQIRVH